jgi:hypothetical protein
VKADVPGDDRKPGPDPGGQLTVTPAGSFIVSTDAMLASVERLRALSAELLVDHRRALAADAQWDGLPITDVAPAIDRARDVCELGTLTITRAAEAYTRNDQFITLVMHEAGARIASLLGPALFALFTGLLVTSPQTLFALAAAGWLRLPDDGDGKLETLRQWILDHPELITDPAFVRFVEATATSIDDAMPVGPFGVPLGPFGPLQPSGGAEAGAATLVALGSAIGMFRETHVNVGRVSTTPGTAPVGVRERLDRIPEGDQVRIEKYESPGRPPRYAVFIGPTETFSPFATDEPFDLTSNVVGVAGGSAGALRAVERAMADAGITAGDEVQVAGFSQGGLIAARIAASGDWNVVGIETFGAPTGNIAMPEGLAGLAVRNSDDFIPALAGPQIDHAVVQVERLAFAGDIPLETEQAVPAHQRTAYERTASAIDAAESGVIRQQIATLDAFATDYLDAPGGEATVMTYHATRVDSLTRGAPSG